jgi:hypothetical protein
MKRLEHLAFAAGLVTLADPVLAGNIAQTPAPIAGIGLGALRWSALAIAH